MEFGLKHKHHQRVLSHFYDFVAVIMFLLEPRLHDTTCCETVLTTGCIVYTAGCQAGLATG